MSKKIKKQDLARLFNDWAKQFAVYVPAREEGVAKMTKWDGRENVDFLDWYRNTTIPPKANFLPNLEKLFSFSKDGHGIQLEAPPAPETQLVFGIRPCDARALALLDMTFSDGYEDPGFIGRRRNAVLVGLACARPYDSCFCTSLGISPAESKDVDLMFIDTGDEFVVEEITEKGRTLIANLSSATDADNNKVREVKEKVVKRITRKVDTDNIAEKILATFEDKEFWDRISSKCISCGICTFLCPTCYCFDINDEMNGKSGARYRNWDSCSFCAYTKMPMENPRQEKWRRVRQKVGHKYEFYPMNFGAIACTGCGRCIRLCPVNWDITQTIESVHAQAANQALTA